MVSQEGRGKSELPVPEFLLFPKASLGREGREVAVTQLPLKPVAREREREREREGERESERESECMGTRTSLDGLGQDYSQAP